MRRLLSILLLGVLGLPFISPLLAQAGDLDAALPACCRRNGVHHCMGGMAQQPSSPSGTRIGSLVARCPVCPATVASVYPGGMLAAHPISLFAALVPIRAAALQSTAKRSLLRGRSRPQRGPPARTIL